MLNFDWLSGIPVQTAKWIFLILFHIGILLLIILLLSILHRLSAGLDDSIMAIRPL